MSEKVKFGDKEISKIEFYDNRKLLAKGNIDLNKMKFSEKIYIAKKTNSYKYFIGYDDNDVIRSILIELPQMIGSVRHFETNQTMSFRTFDKKLFKRYT